MVAFLHFSYASSIDSMSIGKDYGLVSLQKISQINIYAGSIYCSIAHGPPHSGEMQKKERGALILRIWYVVSKKISILWSQLTMCNPFDLLSTSMLKAVQFILEKRRIRKESDQKYTPKYYRKWCKNN